MAVGAGLQGLHYGLAQSGFYESLGSRGQENRDRYYTQGLAALTGGAAAKKPEFSLFDSSSWGLQDAAPAPAVGEAMKPDGSIDFGRLSLYAIRRGKVQDAANFMKLGLADDERRMVMEDRAAKQAYTAELKEFYSQKKGAPPDWSAAAGIAASHGRMDSAAQFSQLGLAQEQTRRQLAQADRKLGQGDRQLDFAERELRLGEEKSFRAFKAQDKQEFAVRVMAAFNPEDPAGSREIIERLVRQSPDMASEVFGVPKEDMKHRKIVGIDVRMGANGEEVWAPVVQNSKTGTTGPMTMQGGKGRDEKVVTINPKALPRYLAPYVPKAKPKDDKWKFSADGKTMMNEKDGKVKKVPTTTAGRREAALEALNDITKGMEKSLDPTQAQAAPRLKATVASVLDVLEKKGIPATAIVNEAARVLAQPNEISNALIYQPEVEKQEAAMSALEQYLTEHYQGAKGGGEQPAGEEKPAEEARPERRTRPAAPETPAPNTPNYGWLERLMSGASNPGLDQTGSLGEAPLQDMEELAKRVREESGLPPEEQLGALEAAAREYAKQGALGRRERRQAR